MFSPIAENIQVFILKKYCLPVIQGKNEKGLQSTYIQYLLFYTETLKAPQGISLLCGHLPVKCLMIPFPDNKGNLM
jgi:hypothetical protein